MSASQRFAWSAHNGDGQHQRGELNARNAQDARNQLRQQGWMGIELQATRHHRQRWSSRMGRRETTLLTRQLATMLSADVPLLGALSLMAQTSAHPAVRDLLEQLHRDIRGGLSLAQALTTHPQHFDDLYRHVVAAGEASGRLDLLLERLASQREQHEALVAQLRSSLMYPVAVLLVAATVVVVILIWVVPTFESVYGSLGANLPALTQGLLDLSRGLIAQAPFIGTTALLLGGTVARLWPTPRARAVVDSLTLRWPVIGRLRRLAASVRWSQTLSTLLDAGIPLNKALVSAAGASGHHVFEQTSLSMAQSVQQGRALTPAMQAAGLFEPVLVQLTAMGESSGTLSTQLAKASALGERELTTELQGLSGLIEPVIIVLLGLVIGTIVLALYWPIFELGQVI
jgi:type IV pilus assembly protein PilC